MSFWLLIQSLHPTIWRLAFITKSETLALLNSRIDPVGVAGVGIGTIVDSERIMSRLSNFIDPKLIHSIDFSEIAESLFNSTTYSNILMLGWVVQNGWIPLTIESVENAIRLNSNFIDKNLLAFRWGRLLAHDPEKVLQLTNKFPIEKKNFQTFENVTAAQSYFSEKLKLYENEAYAKKFDNVINHFKTQSSIQKKYIDRLGIKAARALYRIMAIKD